MAILSPVSFADSYCFILRLRQEIFWQKCFTFKEIRGDVDKYTFLITESNFHSPGWDNNNPFKCFYEVACTAPHWTSDTSPTPVFILPTSVKWAHYLDDVILTHEDISASGNCRLCCNTWEGQDRLWTQRKFKAQEPPWGLEILGQLRSMLP